MLWHSALVESQKTDRNFLDCSTDYKPQNRKMQVGPGIVNRITIKSLCTSPEPGTVFHKNVAPLFFRSVFEPEMMAALSSTPPPPPSQSQWSATSTHPAGIRKSTQNQSSKPWILEVQF